MVKVSFLEKFEGTFVPVKYTPAMMAVLLITLAGTLGLGIFPEKLLEISRAAIFAFL